MKAKTVWDLHIHVGEQYVLPAGYGTPPVPEAMFVTIGEVNSANNLVFTEEGVVLSPEDAQQLVPKAEDELNPTAPERYNSG